MRLLRVLHLEDNKAEKARIERQLQRDGFDVEVIHVGDRPAFLRTLSSHVDVALLGNCVNGYDAIKAMDDAKRFQPAIPMIVVSHELGDERVAELMRCGACDFVLKSKLDALVPAVKRALKQAIAKAEQVRLAGDLRTTQERYRAFIRNSSEAIWRYELDEPLPLDLPEDEQIEHFYRHAYLAEANDAMARMYGYATVEAMLGKRLNEFLPRDDARNVEFLRKFIRNGYRLVDMETRDVNSSGQTLYALNSLMGIIEDGKGMRAWGTNRDITQRHFAEAELARYRSHLEEMVRERTRELEETHQRLSLSERLVSMGTLSAGLGHDMGNLLLPVRCRLDAMEANPAAAPFREDLNAIRKSADYLQRLSTGLRMLALDLNDSTTDLDFTNLNDWWQDAVTVLKNAVPRGVVVVQEFETDILPVRMSRAALTQAIFNLVQNAGDALRGHNNGHVVVWARRSNPDQTSQTSASHQDVARDEVPRVLVGVRDNGTGMLPEVRRRCLEPFFTTKTRGISTGMGLALVHGIVQKVGGAMEVHSTPGQGTNISLNLPATNASLRNTASASTTPGVRPGCIISLRNPRLHAFAASVLDSLGFDVRRDGTFTSRAATGNGKQNGGGHAHVVGTTEAIRSMATLWLVDADRVAMSDIQEFLSESPQRTVVMLGEAHSAVDEGSAHSDELTGGQLMQIREPGNFAALREALRRIASAQLISLSSNGGKTENRLQREQLERRSHPYSNRS